MNTTQLTITQLDELYQLLKDNIYAFPDKKGTYKLEGLMGTENGLEFLFVDNVLGIESFTKTLEQLPIHVRFEFEQAIEKVTI